MRDLIPSPRVSYNLAADEYARLALTAHDRQCRECGSVNSDSRCPAGSRYEAAARRANDDIPAYGN